MWGGGGTCHWSCWERIGQLMATLDPRWRKARPSHLHLQLLLGAVGELS